MAEKEKKTPAAETAPSTQEPGNEHVQAGDFDELGQHLSRELARQLEGFLRGWEERIEARFTRILDEVEARALEATLSHRVDPRLDASLSARDFPVVEAEASVSPDDKVRYRVKVLCKREKGFYRANQFWPGGTWTIGEVSQIELHQLEHEPLLTVEVLHSTD